MFLKILMWLLVGIGISIRAIFYYLPVLIPYLAYPQLAIVFILFIVTAFAWVGDLPEFKQTERS